MPTHETTTPSSAESGAPTDCALCLVREAASADTRCADCARYDDYMRALTPEQRRDEERMIANHVSDASAFFESVDEPEGELNDLIRQAQEAKWREVMTALDVAVDYEATSPIPPGAPS